MIHILFSRVFTLFMSFFLLIAPLPLSAVAKAMADRSAVAQEITTNIAQYEANLIDHNVDVAYVDLSREQSNIAEIVSLLSNLDQQSNSLLHKLNSHIKDEFSVAEYNAVVETLEYAESILQNN